MRILYLGDFIKQNGPSMVDINLVNNLKDYVLKVQIDKKYISVINDIVKVDIINISGVSLKGVIYSIFAKLLGKKITYIMHGALEIEKQYRNVSKNRLLYEKIIINMSDCIICVSEKFEQIVKEKYNIKKTTYINNGIDLKVDNKNIELQQDKYTIITVGGGRRQKGILNVCKAVQLLNNKNIKLIVVGEDGIDTDKIKSYSFVDYRGFVKHDELLNILQTSNIFIQNSYYESFGISVLEAILNKCNVIISKNIGVNIEGVEDYTVDCEDIVSISNVINNIINNDIKQNIDLEFLKELTWDAASEKYLELWKSIT